MNSMNLDGSNYYSESCNNYGLVADAIEDNKPSVVRLLLDGGTLVNRVVSTRNEITLLHLAVEAGRKDITKMLLEAGFNVNARDGSYRTPLDWAIETMNYYGDPETVELLLEIGATVDSSDYWGRTPLHGLAICSGFDVCVKMLIEQGANLEYKDRVRGYTALHYATKYDFSNYELVEMLLNEGADVNAQTRGNNLTPLHIAAERKNLYLAQILLDHGANIGALDVDQATPLHHASKFGGSECVRLLLERGANVNVRNKYNSTPLLLAILRGHYEIVKILLHYCPDLDDRRVLAFSLDCLKEPQGEKKQSEEDKETSIHEALEKYGFTLYDCNPLDSLWVSLTRSNYEKAKLLMGEGFKPDQIQDNQEFLNQAIRSKREDVLELLIEAGVSVNSIGDHSGCPLIVAIQEQLPSMVRILLHNGADPNWWDSPLHPLIEWSGVKEDADQSKEILDYLLEYDIDIDSINAYSYREYFEFSCATGLGGDSLLPYYGADLFGFECLYCPYWSDELDPHPRLSRTNECKDLIYLIYKLHISGSFVSDYNLWRLKQYQTSHMEENWEDFSKIHSAEVARMRRHELCSGFSLHQIFVSEDLGYLSNQVLMDKLEQVNFMEFPKYGNLLNCKLKRDKNRNENLGLIRGAFNFILLVRSTICKDLPKRLPIELVDKIISQLDKLDQKHLVTCGQSLKKQLLR